MNVYIANFGRENYEWLVCKAESSIATMNDIADQPFWEAGDKDGYVEQRMKVPTARGSYPTKGVASRWFNLMTIINESVGDIWIHREKDRLWWTVSKSEPSEYRSKIEPVEPKREVVVCYKPCEPWSCKNKNGNRLDWDGLHAKAKDFLFTESTLQRLQPANAEYAIALIAGEDLSRWHSQAVWDEKAKKSKNKGMLGRSLSAKEISVFRMVRTAIDTVAGANGQEIQKVKKEKRNDFKTEEAFKEYVESLIVMQEGLCAITGLTLQFDNEDDDPQFLCSLDRINSDEHYSPGNLQVVCRFINRWKGADDDSEFRRLIGAVQL
jgi:hypothetical protein